jgi:hypothetical protein
MPPAGRAGTWFDALDPAKMALLRPGRHSRCVIAAAGLSVPLIVRLHS